MPKNKTSVKKQVRSHKKSEPKHPKHFLKVYWPYIPVILLVVGSLVFGNVAPHTRVNNPATLAYATEMSISGLLSATNAQRASNGLGPLTSNSKLNSSALAKANDMVARDYWAHNTPDGQEPWIFFDAAGYSYEKAGENLAYGFSSSSATVTGWMNSPSHRANVLDSTYTEVGFGFVNGANFVGTGEETIVVAHYAKPPGAVATPAPAPAPAAAPAAAPQSLPASTPQTKPTEVAQQPVDTPVEPVENTNEDLLVSEEASSPVNEDAPINTDQPVPAAAPAKNITRLQQLTGGVAPWSALVVSVLALTIGGIWLTKHAILVKRFVYSGEHFVAHHPIIDVVVVTFVAIAVYLSQASGVVL